MKVWREAASALLISCFVCSQAVAIEAQNQTTSAPQWQPGAGSQAPPGSAPPPPIPPSNGPAQSIPSQASGDTIPPASQDKVSIRSWADETFFQPDVNREVYYRNKLELGVEAGILPINTPLLVGPIFGYSLHRPHSRWAAYYTLVPVIASIRWQLYDPIGPWFLRGNTEFTFGGTYTAITEGPESIFTGPLMGVRYNFVQRNWKLVPYADLRVGLGYTDAQEPYQVRHHLREDGQGQDFTFTFLMSAGFRYNFSPRYSVSLGFMAMHISNMYLSEPQYYNHGVNVVGPMAGFNVGLNDLWRKSVAALRR